ncbi:preprotein translocase subunit YajC [Anaerovorax odorimutans]|uniref:Preprotein translocase subunit YajC n=1 Tax=Anaerovorax odorimutans TaxID=109327 RepID=A0ABT1RL57_9FIRM|nr:preprotein translocase subunit YajC [Anaerovorax odorimutans]MCQ4635917.1 preprotein translocase subunit YajC [Anaerovorax odorimutans]
MNGNMLATLLPLVLLLVVMYFLLIRPQKKREKQVNQMRSNVRVGDEIITIGGICGKVVKTKEESLVIQVGADKVKFEVMRWSISKVVENANAKPTKKVSVSSEEETEEEEAPKKAMPRRLKKKAAEEEKAEEPETAEEAAPEQEPAEEAAAEEEK